MALERLSSGLGGHDQSAARAVAARCSSEPALFSEILAGLTSSSPATAAACAGILATVAETEPALLAPYGEQFMPLLSHRTSNVRWQAMQVVAAIARYRPGLIEPILPRLMATIETDTSIITRDKATEAIAGYAGSSAGAARQAGPFLEQALTIANGRFASRALDGLRLALNADPSLAERLLPIAEHQLDHHRGVARTAAKRLLRAAHAELKRH